MCPICNTELATWTDGTDTWDECENCYKYRNEWKNGANTIIIGCFTAVIFWDDSREKKDETEKYILKVAEMYREELDNE